MNVLKKCYSNIYVKKIQRIINEALGVPNEIDMIVDIYTDLVIDRLKQDIVNKSYKTRKVDATNYGEWDMVYGKLKISANDSWRYVESSPKFNIDEWRKFPLYRNKFEITYQVIPEKTFELQGKSSPQIGGTHAFKPGEMKIKNLKSRGDVYDVGYFEFDFHMNEENFENPDSMRDVFKSVMAHEIFHSFQLYTKFKKTGKVGYGKESVYNFLQNILKSNFSQEWNDFTYLLYLSLRFEHQARIPQVYNVLKNKKITNYDEFMDEIRKTDVWDEIKKLRSFSAKKIINDLSKISGLEDIIFAPMKRQELQQNIANWNDFIEIVMQKLSENGTDVGKIRKLGSNILSNPESFFTYWEKRFHNRAEELVKKISKLYHLVKK